MVISGKCSVVFNEDIIGIFEQKDRNILIRTAYDQTVSFKEQGYEKLEQFFRRRFELENRNLIHEQEIKDVKRSEYVRG